MSEVGDLLELMHGARERWRTVRATIRTWRHLERHGAAWHAWGEAQSGRRGSSVTFYGVVNEDAEPDPEASESRTRLWIDGDRVREEHEGDPYPHFAVSVGELWWRYDEHNGAMSNEDAREIGSGIGDEFRYLFDSASLIGGLRFEPLDRTHVAGGDGIRVRAVARETDDLASTCATCPVAPTNTSSWSTGSAGFSSVWLRDSKAKTSTSPNFSRSTSTGSSRPRRSCSSRLPAKRFEAPARSGLHAT